MSKKVTLSGMKKQLDAPTIEAKEPAKKQVVKKEIIKKTNIPTKKKKAVDVQIPRGERGDFLKTSITISAQQLTDVRSLGMRRKSNKEKDTDFSALVREALTDLLNKHK